MPGLGFEVFMNMDEKKIFFKHSNTTKMIEVISKSSIEFKVSRPRSAGQERGTGAANRRNTGIF
jgi:hypothetical protein